MVELPDFIIVPKTILLDSSCSPLDGYVYGIVYWFKRLKNEKCTASNRTIADMIGASVDGVRHSIYHLAELGYVEIIYKDEAKTIRDQIIPMIAFDTQGEGGLNQPGGVVEINQGGGSNEPGGGGSFQPQNKKINNKKNKEESHPSLDTSNEVEGNTSPPAHSNLSQDITTVYEAYKNYSQQDRVILTPERRKKIQSRLKNFTVAEINQAMQNCFADVFYSGGNDRGWRANIDYIFRNDEIMEKLLLLKPRSKEGTKYGKV